MLITQCHAALSFICGLESCIHYESWFLVVHNAVTDCMLCFAFCFVDFLWSCGSDKQEKPTKTASKEKEGLPYTLKKPRLSLYLDFFYKPIDSAVCGENRRNGGRCHVLWIRNNWESVIPRVKQYWSAFSCMTDFVLFVWFTSLCRLQRCCMRQKLTTWWFQIIYMT